MLVETLANVATCEALTSTNAVKHGHQLLSCLLNTNGTTVGDVCTPCARRAHAVHNHAVSWRPLGKQRLQEMGGGGGGGLERSS